MWCSSHSTGSPNESAPGSNRERGSRSTRIRSDSISTRFTIGVAPTVSVAMHLGIQSDAIYSEDSGEADDSFDTVWSSHGTRTHEGYIVAMSIPFRSLRFPPREAQEWGLLVWRWIARRSEGSWWPRNTPTIRGWLSQSATVSGVIGIAGSRNSQLIPYGSWRAFRARGSRPEDPPYVSDLADLSAGVDTKHVIKDSLVLDLTVNPDFSQVESDEPQSVVNQRFEVYFPERRPFFIENASFFDVPLVDSRERILFTRRIADPSLGARLTGKIGRYSIGTVIADDQSPGRGSGTDGIEGSRALFDVVRISRDIGPSSVGFVYTDRRFRGTFNRVAGVDGIWRLSRTWSATLLAANSWTSRSQRGATRGRDIEAAVKRESRVVNYWFHVIDRAPGFRNDSGYMPRSDQRVVAQSASYTMWPRNRRFTSLKLELSADRAWDASGLPLFWHARPAVTMELRQATSLTVFSSQWGDTLRPRDYPDLTRVTFFDEHARGISFTSRYFRFATFQGAYERGEAINYIPPRGMPPTAMRYDHGELFVAFRHLGRLTIANSYIFDSGRDPASNAGIFTANVFRSRWNWQLTRALSVRAIGQYNSLSTNPALTSARAEKSINADFLLTYLVHPGTALYLGYNSDFRNPLLLSDRTEAPRFGNDGRQFFLKISYLIRP
jgi:hypothetical protein